jgi:hypothetical protein
MRVFLLFVLGASAFAQIQQPRIGMMLDGNGDVRPVWGVAAAATLGSPILSGVISLACSDGKCEAKTVAGLAFSNGERGEIRDAPAGPAVFGGSYVYFSQTQQLVRWHDGQLEAIDFTRDGQILGLRPTRDGFDSIVNHDGATWLEHWSRIDSSLRVVNAYAPAAAAMFMDDGILLAANDTVHRIRDDGTDTIINVAGVQALIAMGDGYVELVTSQGLWALDLAHMTPFLLPGVAP